MFLGEPEVRIMAYMFSWVASLIWWVVDIFLVFKGVKKDNLKKLSLALGEKSE